MANVYSHSFFRGAFPLDGVFNDSLAVVPEGVVWVLREIDLSIGTISPNDEFSVWVQFPLLVAKLTLISLGCVINAGVQAQWEGRLVLQTNDIIGVTGDGEATNTVVAAASGYVLTLP